MLAIALITTPQGCVDIKQQCRACPTDDQRGCSSVGIACQPIRRVCEAAAPAKAKPRTDDRNASATPPR